jgi:hypothetical protein
MSSHPQVMFSYDSLDPETRQFIETKTDELHGLMKRTAQSIIRIGHGHFEAWLHAEFEMTDRHARRFMRVAEQFGDKVDKMSDYSASVLYELAAPSTSES